MKKSIWKPIVTVGLLAGLLAGCGQDDVTKGAADGQIGTARVAIDTAAGGSFQIRAANAEGYFKESGIETQISNFAYGIDTVNALLTKQTDTGLAADYALLNSLNKGDFVVVSSLTGSDETKNIMQYSEILTTDNIDEPGQLKGKKIGVAKGTVAEYQWARYLEHLNIHEDDVKYIPYSTPDEAIVGMKKGDIEAVIGTGALVDKFKSVEGVQKIDALDSVEGLNTTSYLIVDRAYAEKNEALLTEFIKGVDQGITFTKEKPDATAEIANKELKIDKSDVLKDLERQNFTIGFTQEDFDHLNEMKAYLVAEGLLKEDYDLAEKLFLAPAKAAIPDKVTYTK